MSPRPQRTRFMKEFFHKHRRKFVTLLLLALPFLLMATGDGDDSVGRPKRSRAVGLLRGSLTWTQARATPMLAQATDATAHLGSGAPTPAIEALERENARLREENARLIGILQENMRLRELVGFKTRHPEFELVPARVVSRDISPFFRVLRVQIKPASPVQERMPVVVAGGVVGQVHEVFDDYAEVVLVSDPRSRIDVVSQRNRAQGVVQGLGHERDYQAKIAYLDEKDEVRGGDVMVTSGMGGVFPPELIIGTISQVTPDERGLFQRAILQPAVDLSRLQEVFVVTGRTRPPTP